jgi:hypothetical protein
VLIEENCGVGMRVGDRNAVRLIAFAQRQISVLLRFDKRDSFVVGKFLHASHIKHDQ